MTGVLGGLSASNLGAAAAGGMAPYIANKIKQATSKVVDGQEQTNVLANTMAHAVAGAVLAQLAGNNATAGAAGAAGGELMARAILNSMYPGKQASDLTQDEKQIVSALGQLAAQLSAGVASGSVEGGIQGAVAGKNAVENNTLGSDEEELQREHGNRPVKIISIKPAQAGIVDDEGSIRSVGGKVILPVAIKDLPATTGKAGTSSESGKDAKVVEPYITTSPIAVSGRRAIDKAQSYESGLREKYGNVPYTERQYTTIISGKRVNGVADNVTIINGQRTAVEAKFVEDWGNSLRNPTSSVGSKPWSVAEQTKMLDQARKYSAAFEGGVIYHTNSPELADHYSKLFADAGVNKFKFIITPVK